MPVNEGTKLGIAILLTALACCCLQIDVKRVITFVLLKHLRPYSCCVARSAVCNYNVRSPCHYSTSLAKLAHSLYYISTTVTCSKHTAPTNCECSDKIQYLGLTFLKAGHNKNAEGLYEIQLTEGEINFQPFQTFGILQNSHFCSLCIACRDNPEVF